MNLLNERYLDYEVILGGSPELAEKFIGMGATMRLDVTKEHATHVLSWIAKFVGKNELRSPRSARTSLYPGVSAIPVSCAMSAQEFDSSRYLELFAPTESRNWNSMSTLLCIK